LLIVVASGSTGKYLLKNARENIKSRRSELKAKNKVGVYSLIGLIIFLILIYAANLFGPSPDSVDAIGIFGNAQWLIILWGYWIDRNRE
jgi:formate-dependent nitrite reductase membrane component NrfD